MGAVDTQELEPQPAQDQKTEEAQEPYDTTFAEEEQVPIEKSHVGLDANKAMQSGLYEKGDRVHMQIIAHGRRMKGVFTVAKSAVHRSGDYVVYRLVDSENQYYNKGEWVRENKLAFES